MDAKSRNDKKKLDSENAEMVREKMVPRIAIYFVKDAVVNGQLQKAMKRENKQNGNSPECVDSLNTPDLTPVDEVTVNHVAALPVGLSRCECDVCRALGAAATHNGIEHDTSVDQTLEFRGRKLRILGGTTRSARVLARTLEGRHDFEGRRVAELGAGTGLVTQALVHLGAEVWSTDQTPVLDLLEKNLLSNLTAKDKSRVHVMPLYWGDLVEIATLQEASFPGLDMVVGADLIFARENNSALVRTVLSLCPPGKRFMLALTRRFAFEEDFFLEMETWFDEESWEDDGDVSIVTWRRRQSV